MYRIAIEKLLKWKQSKRRKPLIIEGARQVGKNLADRHTQIRYILILTPIPEWQNYLPLTWIRTV